MGVSFAQFRLQKDAENILVGGIKYKLIDNVFYYEIKINNEYYCNTYMFECIISDKYPFESPKVYCRTKTFHPNIFEMEDEKPYKGSVCLNILRLGWMPSYDLNSIIVSTVEIFEAVSYEDPYFIEAAEILQYDKEGFKKRIKEVEKE